MRRSNAVLSLLALLIACAKSPVAAPTTLATSSIGVVDSALPREELLHRFRQDLPEVTAFTAGASGREALGRRVLDALARRDTAQLRALVVTQAEFGWLYYPTSAQGLPPYDLSPGLYWFMLQERSDRGLRWLLEHPVIPPGQYVGLDCGTRSTAEGPNVTWGPCYARWIRARGDTIGGRIFSQIVERKGRFKVLTYSGGQE